MITLQNMESSGARVYPGKVNASQRVDLAFQVSGPLIELPVIEGDLVEAGQIVAQIRKEDFTTALETAKGKLETAQSQLQAMETGARPEDISRLQAQLSAAQAELKRSEVDYLRNKELLREEVIPQSRFDLAEAIYEVSKSKLQSAHDELEIGLVGARPEDIAAQKAEVASLRSAVDQAQIDLNDTTLLAPFTGRIARKYVDNFKNVQSKEPVLSLQDISNVEIIVQLPETDVITAKKEDIARIYAQFDAIADRKFDLRIKEFSTEADDLTQTFEATLVMPAPEDVNILPGMTAKVSIDYGTRTVEGESGYKVPLAAILNESENQNFVWKVDPSSMKVSKTPVALGNLSGDSVMVTEGVAGGDLIATAGVHFLREGMQVKPLNASSDKGGDQG